MHLPSVTRQIPTPPGTHTRPTVVARTPRSPRPSRPEAPNAAPEEPKRSANDGRLERMHDALARRLSRIRTAHRSQSPIAPTQTPANPSGSEETPPNPGGPSVNSPSGPHAHGRIVLRREFGTPVDTTPDAPVDAAPETPVDPTVSGMPVETREVPGDDDGGHRPGHALRRIMHAVRSLLRDVSKELPDRESRHEIRGLGRDFRDSLREIRKGLQDGGLDREGARTELDNAFQTLADGLRALFGGSDEPVEPGSDKVDFDGTVQATPDGGVGGPVIGGPVVEEPAGATKVDFSGTIQATPAGVAGPVVEEPAGSTKVDFSGTIQASPDLGMVDAPPESDVPNLPAGGNDGMGPVQDERLRSILQALRLLRASLIPGGQDHRTGLLPNEMAPANPEQRAVPAPKPAAPEAPVAPGLPVASRMAAARSAFTELRAAHEHPHPGGRFDRIG